MDGWMDGWMDRWVDEKAGLRIAYSNQLKKPIMARFLKFKFLFIYKLNFNGGQFYKKNIKF